LPQDCLPFPPCCFTMAVARAMLLVKALFLVSLASVVTPLDGAPSGLAVIPQVVGPATKPVTKPNELAQGAPLYVFSMGEEAIDTQRADSCARSSKLRRPDFWIPTWGRRTSTHPIGPLVRIACSLEVPFCNPPGRVAMSDSTHHRSEFSAEVR